MKKMLILGLVAMSTVGFANMGYGSHNNGGHRNSGNYGHSNSRYTKNGNVNNRRILTEDEMRENRKNSIVVQEKKLAMRKLMAEKNVDWKKVATLDSEISKLRSTNRVERMKKNHTFYMNNTAK